MELGCGFGDLSCLPNALPPQELAFCEFCGTRGNSRVTLTSNLAGSWLGQLGAQPEMRVDPYREGLHTPS